MFDLLPDRLPWYVAGPSLGLLVVGFFLVANQPLGASGAYVHTSLLFRRRTDTTRWRVSYFVGMLLGGFVVTQLLRESSGIRSGYEPLRDALPLGLVIPLVLAGAILIGYGAAMSGGCTSGHGLCGTAQRSPASVVATITFITTGIITTFVLGVVSGGSL